MSVIKSLEQKYGYQITETQGWINGQRVMWEVKIVPLLNHDLFSFTKAMKEGWQMNGRWKEGGLMIEQFKTTKDSMKFDRMIPSGSSWLIGIKTQRLVGQAHAVIEPGKSIPIWKFHQMTGNKDTETCGSSTRGD